MPERHHLLIAAALSIALLLFGRMLGDLLLKPLLILLPKVRQDMAFLLMYLRFIGVLLLTAIYCAWAEKEVWKSFFSRRQGGMPGNTASHFFLGIVAGAGIIGFCILIAFLHGGAELAAGGFHVVYLLGGLLCVLIQAGAEELVFRGYLLGVIRLNREDWGAVLISAGLFAAIHLLNPGMTMFGCLRLFISGVVLGLMVCRCKSLWMAIAFHTAWNYAQTFVFGLPVAGMVSEKAIFRISAVHSSLFYDAVAGVEGCLPAFLTELALCFAILFMTEGKRK